MADAKNDKDYDALTSFLGDYGCFQILMMVLLSLSAVPPGYMGMMAVFVADTPEYRCRAPPLNSTLNGSSSSSSSATTPGPDSCSRYRVSGNGTGVSNDTEPCAHGWDYSTDVYINTIVTEWDLVCGNAWKVPVSTSIFFVGVLIGTLCTGHLSDRFGRKPLFFSTVVLQAITALIQGTSINWLMYCFLNCLRGISQMSCYVLSLILGSEMLSKSSRVAFIMVGHCLGYGIGYAILPFFAYFIRSWRMLLMISAIPSILYIPTWWVIPESPRWLLHKGRVEEAELVIRNAAKINKIPSPEVIFKADECLELMKEKGENENTYNYLDLLRTRNLRNIIIIGVFLWMSVSMVFHGISLNTSNMNGNKYLNCFFSALIDIITYLTAWLFANRMTRPTLMFCAMMLSGVMLLVIQLIPEDMQIMMQVFTLGGKIGIAAAFCFIYVFFTELFPTVVRNMGFGVVSTAAHMGSIICPFIIYTGIYLKVLPFIIFGATSFVAAAVNMLLPDTRNSKLPDLISETKPIRRCCFQKENVIQQSDVQEKV
ncbi:organic cation/carnitine transporter 2-like [Nelusetta ayraudi]|uniref:organic cation/carnitine transporter 2-like n=1 Tax=Nelusetta ayraudi TaxID=303726 RepID=UPI003F71B827